MVGYAKKRLNYFSFLIEIMDLKCLFGEILS